MAIGEKGFQEGGEKRGGRKKGTPNKTQSEIRERFNMILDDNLDQLKDDLKAMKPAERVKAILELSKFVVPHLKAVELSAAEGDGQSIVYINLGFGQDPGQNDHPCIEQGMQIALNDFKISDVVKPQK